MDAPNEAIASPRVIKPIDEFNRELKELMRIMSSQTQTTQNDSKVAEKAQAAKKVALVRRISAYRYCRKIEPTKESNEFDQTKKPERYIPPHDLVDSNIKKQSQLTKQTLRDQRENLNQKRNEAITAARTRQKQMDEEQLTEALRLEQIFLSGDTAKRAALKKLVALSIASRFLMRFKPEVRTQSRRPSKPTEVVDAASPNPISAPETSQEEEQVVAQEKEEEHAVSFLQDFIKTRILMKKRREQVGYIWRFLKSWKDAGLMLIALKRYHHRIILIQRFFRQCLEKIHSESDKVSHQWETLEQDLISADLGLSVTKRTSSKPKPKSSKGEGALLTRTEQLMMIDSPLSATDRINSLMVPVDVRSEFIRKEMKQFRIGWLQEYNYRKNEVKIFWRKVQDWRDMKAARKAMEFSDDGDEANTATETKVYFESRPASAEQPMTDSQIEPLTDQSLPTKRLKGLVDDLPDYPFYVSYMPSEDEVLSMIERCRVEWRRQQEANRLFRIMQPAFRP